MSDIVVIVESPTKAKSIQSFLGRGYIVKASMGHVADLPAKLPPGAKSVGVSVTSSSPPEVTFPYGMPVLDGKKQLVAGLKSLCRGKEVLLATDPDREGEAIAWCLYNLLKGSAKNMKRVTFGAITPEAVQKGLSKPRDIDKWLVAAQLGRRSLDRLFGYGLSILASNALGVNRLSVGRVQTAVLSMVVDREREIAGFKPEPRYAVVLDDEHGNRYRSKVFENKEEAEKLLQLVKGLVSAGRLSVREVKSERRNEAPQPPFRTSSMQQAAAKMFNWSPTKTMSVAQSLFEDKHLITYHRSDSIRVDEETRAAQKKFAEEVWPDLVPEKPNIYRNAGGAQDAHECIHPNYLDAKHSPDAVRGKLSPDEQKLYEIIWGRFHGAMAKPALWDTLSVKLADGNKGDTLLEVSGKNMVFEGWRRLDPTAPQAKDKVVAGNPKQGDKVTGESKIDIGYTKPPPPYDTPLLLKDMEKHGVGRPATAATAIDTLFTRGYVETESRKKTILSTPLGRGVVDWAGEVCPELRDVKYTSRMEEELDLVSEGKDNWKRVVADFHDHVLIPSVKKGRELSEGTKFRLAPKDMPLGPLGRVPSPLQGEDRQAAQTAKTSYKKKTYTKKSPPKTKGASRGTSYSKGGPQL